MPSMSKECTAALTFQLVSAVSTMPVNASIDVYKRQALDHPVILAADRLMPTDLFSVPSGLILGVITAEGSGQSHAAIRCV